jgi:hypothetical protein
MRKNPYPGFGSEHAWAITGKVFATLTAINIALGLIGVGVFASTIKRNQSMNLQDIDPFKA